MNTLAFSLQPLAFVPILNRDFQHPADGWYQIEALGNHPNRAAGVVQVIDAEAAHNIVNRFNSDAAAGQLRHGTEMLIDHEHFSDQPEQETRAYGWLQELQNREDGIYGRIRWTSTGKAAVDGGDYRFFSTEYDPGDLQNVENRKQKAEMRMVRPLRLAGLTLTNMNNNRGQRPITNRGAPVSPPGAIPDSELAGSETGPPSAVLLRRTGAPILNKAKCGHLNEDGTFKGGFDGCVLHMQSACGGSHSEESARKICGKIAQNVANREGAPVSRPGSTQNSNGNAPGGDTGAPTTFASMSVPADSPALHSLGDGGHNETNENAVTNNQMKTVCTLLGLSADADEASAHAAVTKLLNRAAGLESENQTLLGEQIVGLLAEHKITDEKIVNRLKPVLTPLKNREERLECLADFGFTVGGGHQSAATQHSGRVLNRGAGSASIALATEAQDDAMLAQKIKNRAKELHVNGRTFDSAWQQASQEILVAK